MWGGGVEGGGGGVCIVFWGADPTCVSVGVKLLVRSVT